MIALSNLLYHTGQRISPIDFCPNTITHACLNIIVLETWVLVFFRAQSHKCCANAVTVCWLLVYLFVCFLVFFKTSECFCHLLWQIKFCTYFVSNTCVTNTHPTLDLCQWMCQVWWQVLEYREFSAPNWTDKLIPFTWSTEQPSGGDKFQLLFTCTGPAFVIVTEVLWYSTLSFIIGTLEQFVSPF